MYHFQPISVPRHAGCGRKNPFLKYIYLLNNQEEENEKGESEQDKALLHAKLLERVAHIYCPALFTGKRL